VRRHRQPRQFLIGDQAKAVLEAEIAAGNGRFRGIRHSSAWTRIPMWPTCMRTAEGHSARSHFPQGFACLGPLGLSFDAWLFHPQIGELTDLAALPETRIVLDHCGGPVGTGRFAGKRAETSVWKASIQEIAKCENVAVKLGGLAMCCSATTSTSARSRRRRGTGCRLAALCRNLHRGLRPEPLACSRATSHLIRANAAIR